MKRQLLQLGVVLLLAGSFASADAQITIDQGDFPVATTSHRANELHVSNDSSYTIPTDGANQVWDYQGFITNVQSSFPYSVTTDTFFSTSHHYEAGIVSLAGFRILTDIHFGLDAIGYYEYGKQQYDTTFSIAAITGGASDEVHFLDGKEYYGAGVINQIYFPMGMGDAWVDTITRTTPFEITVAGFGLNGTPGVHKRIAYYDKAVTGFGKLVMTHPLGQASDSMDVLLTKTTEVRIDSFFVGGAPAPTPLLQGLGLVQGQTATTYKTHFYRQGYGDHIVEFESSTPAGGSSVVSIFSNQDAILSTMVGTEEPAFSSLNMYPNPVQNGGNLNIDLSGEATAIAAVRILTMHGKEVYRNDALIAGQKNTQIKLPEALPAGTYLVQEYSVKGQTLRSAPLMIID